MLPHPQKQTHACIHICGIYATNKLTENKQNMCLLQVLPLPVEDLQAIFRLAIGPGSYLNKLIVYAKYQQTVSYIYSVASVLNTNYDGTLSPEWNQTQLQVGEI